MSHHLCFQAKPSLEEGSTLHSSPSERGMKGRQWCSPGMRSKGEGKKTRGWVESRRRNEVKRKKKLCWQSGTRKGERGREEDSREEEGKAEGGGGITVTFTLGIPNAKASPSRQSWSAWLQVQRTAVAREAKS